MGPLTIPGMSQLPFPTSYFSSTPTKHPPYGLSEEGKSLMNNWAPFNPTSGRGYLSKKNTPLQTSRLASFGKNNDAPTHGGSSVRRRYLRFIEGPLWGDSSRLEGDPSGKAKIQAFQNEAPTGQVDEKSPTWSLLVLCCFFGGVDEESDLGCSKKGHLRTGNLKHLDKDPLQCWLLCLYYSCT